MMMVKPYTVCVNRMCLIKGASYELMSDGYVYSILDTIPNYGRKKKPGTDTFLPVCAYPSIYNAHVWIILLWARA